MTVVREYGSWDSPIRAAHLVAGDQYPSNQPVHDARFVGDDIWWAQTMPTPDARVAVKRKDDGPAVEVLRSPWSARTRVREYGGGAWTAAADGTLFFCEFTDQRVYRVDAPGRTPIPVTGEPLLPAGVRFSELTVVDAEIWAVREDHTASGGVVRDICAFPRDGSAVESPRLVRRLAGGSDFLAYPRLSPDRRFLAWIAWNHPKMPWDESILMIADVADDGSVCAARPLAGGPSESLLQPEWRSATELTVISDRSGWWNVYAVHADQPHPELRPLHPMPAEFGAALWQLGERWALPLGLSHTVTAHVADGVDHLGIIGAGEEFQSSTVTDRTTRILLWDVRAEAALVSSSGPRQASTLQLVSLDGSFTATDVDGDRPVQFDAYISTPTAVTFPGHLGHDVHGFLYQPSNPDVTGSPGTLPPYIVSVHGGPTLHSTTAYDLMKAYFTSRGIGVLDVNYGGSTSHGREYRERLRGQWGVLDAYDVAAGARWLADAGWADPSRIAIKGGSAGGWTVLAALAATDAFACGICYYGVTDPFDFALTTHDYESRYLDGLLGALPEYRQTWTERSALRRVADIEVPVFIMHGVDDPVVPVAQARAIRSSLHAHGRQFAYREYENESHVFRLTKTLIDVREAELAFLGATLGFEVRGTGQLKTSWYGESAEVGEL